MSRYLFGLAAATVLAAGTTLGAGTLQSQEPSTREPTAQQPATPPATPRANTPVERDDSRPGLVTVEGCVAREQDVPGRDPGLLEKAGIAGDYILTDAEVINGSAPSASARNEQDDKAAGASGAVGTSGRSAQHDTFEIEGVDDDRLQEYVGQRVRIEGRFERGRTGAARGDAGSASDDLPELHVSAIRKASGDCPQKP